MRTRYSKYVSLVLNLTMVKSLKKALDIMEFVSESNNSPSIVQIANHLKINRTTTYRIVHTLHSQGYLKKDEDKNRYQIGLRLLPMAARLLDSNKLRKESLPHLQELAQETGERINLGIIFQGEVLYLGGVEKPSLPVVYTRFGKKAPVHCCSLGKILLAYLPEQEVDRILSQKPLVKMTENTITDPGTFKKHLAEIRTQGYAIDYGEHIPGSYCISALIRDTTRSGIGSISISSGSLEKLKGYLELLLQTAEVISHLMGYMGR